MEPRSLPTQVKSVENVMTWAKNVVPSTSPFLSTFVRNLHVFTCLSSPVVTNSIFSFAKIGLNEIEVIPFSPCGRLIRLFNIQNPEFLSHHHIFRYTSGRNPSSPILLSTVAIHSPDAETAACRTLGGSRCFSSLRDTRFDGDTSISYSSREFEGEYACRDEGWDEVRMREDERGCTASGTEVDVDGASGLIKGSGGEVRYVNRFHNNSLNLVLIGKMSGKSSEIQS